MCAIAGAGSRAEVEHMLDRMRHRAPDDLGIADDRPYVLGMGRLKIIDLISGGLCPIRDGELVLAFNGEIYNYVELRTELTGLGHTFISQGDSEVLLKAYRQWGEACLDKLNGMFAFAIHDGVSVFLARDIAGEKPLYYVHLPDGSFKFASEAKALGYACAELPPAHMARYTIASKELHIAPWWHFVPHEREINFDQAVETLDRLLADAVRIRTRSDVPYGLYYSGGIDSTLIGTYHDFSHRFTYTDGDFREEFNETFPTILWHLDYPVSTFSPFGLWKLAQQAQERGVKVVLSGEGADELFGGYTRYIQNEFNRRASKRFPSYPALFPHRNMLWEEFTGNMRELLRMGDRMAGAWGIENRCPFLDKRVIEFAFSLPMEHKIRDLDTKLILREVLRNRMPAYQFSEKHGLYCSVNDWIGVPEAGFSKGPYRTHQQKLWEDLPRDGSKPIKETTPHASIKRIPNQPV